MSFKKGYKPWNFGLRTIVKCSYCEKEFSVNNSRILKNKNFFCCPEHRYKWQNGINNPMYGKHQSLLCKNKTREMAKKQIGKLNPMFNKRIDTSGCNFYIEDLGHRCRSTWEINIGRILKYLNIKYKYEHKTFDLSKGDSYTPDFYISKLNLYLEIKGYETDKFKEKFIRFKKEYPNINIILINYEIYNLLEPIYKDIIDWETSSKIKKNFSFKDGRIIKIKKSTYIQKNIYNLSIEDDESFIVNGLVVHNTYPHYVSADKLKAWCKLKLGDENLAWAVRGHIAKYGTKPQPFVREITNQKLEEYLIEALQVKGAVRLIQK
jgi:hypothetical protein